MARACDDYIRSGCGAKVFGYEGRVPGQAIEDPDAFQKAIQGCIASYSVTVTESLSEKESEGELSDPDKARHVMVMRIGDCSRNAKSCNQMGDCFRGVFTFPPLPSPLAEKVPPPAPPPTPVTKEPYWKEVYKGTGPDPLSNETPWGKPADLMPVDSPSCAACAIERCPTMAYLCFGANGVEKHCLAGDCCHSLRKCIAKCGGYNPMAEVGVFDNCLENCSENKVKAAQQLINLQKCAADACKGCEKFDSFAEKSGATP
jgi:hypothetical protein